MANGLWHSCRAESICEKKLVYQKEWKIDYESKNSFFNWVDPSNMDLTCTPDHVIGMVGSAFFLGWMLSSTFLPNYCNFVGRKWPLLAACVLHCICHAVNLLSTSINLTITSYFFIGVSTSIRAPFTSTYLNELIPEENRVTATTALCVADAIGLILQVIYFTLSRNTYPLHAFLLLCTLTSTLSLLYLPESPKFFYASRRFGEARDVMGRIARINGFERGIEGVLFDVEGKGLVEGEREMVDGESAKIEENEEEVIELTGNVKEIITIW